MAQGQQSNNKTLLVCVPDKLSKIIEKGEIIPRYYNPGNLFDTVHILSMAQDNPDLSVLQKMVGDARVTYQSAPLLPKYFLYRTFGYNPHLIKNWTNEIISMCQNLAPDMVRCHGFGLNLIVASEIKKHLSIPVVASLHTTPERQVAQSIRKKLETCLASPSLKQAVQNTDISIGVYKPNLPYLKKIGAKHVELAYNVVGTEIRAPKCNYEVKDSTHFVYIGRILKGKNPENIIRALKDIPNAHLTIIGDGPYRARIENLIDDLHISNRVSVIPSIDNDELSSSLPNYDVCVLHSDYWEIPKTMIEASLAAMPIITNRHDTKHVPEFENNFCYLVQNSPESYADAMIKMASDSALRAEYGQKSFKLAQEIWAPEKTEKKYADLYKSILPTL